MVYYLAIILESRRLELCKITKKNYLKHNDRIDSAPTDARVSPSVYKCPHWVWLHVQHIKQFLALSLIQSRKQETYNLYEYQPQIFNGNTSEIYVSGLEALAYLAWNVYTAYVQCFVHHTCHYAVTTMPTLIHQYLHSLHKLVTRVQPCIDSRGRST